MIPTLLTRIRRLCLCAGPLLALLPGPSEAQETEKEILMIFPVEGAAPSDSFSGFQERLFEKLNRDLVTGFILRLTDIPLNSFFTEDTLKRANVRVAVQCRFISDSLNQHHFGFKILDLKTGGLQEKKIALAGLESEDAAQVVLLKLRDFLETSILSRLNITSVPLGLEVALNREPSGRTPKEFLLKKGTYFIEVSAPFLATYRDRISLSPGTAVNIKANMEFKGHPTRLWLLGSSIATWEALVFMVLNIHMYKNYKGIQTHASPGEIDEAYDRYRRTGIMSITMAGIAGAGWITTGYCALTNKLLKKKIYSNLD